MKRLRFACVIVGLFAFAPPALSKPPCPPSKYPPPYPWFIPGPLNGDDYADIYIDIDKAGNPVACRMGRNNIPGDNKFFICKAFLDQWKTAPPDSNSDVGPPPADLPSHSPIVGTVHRVYDGYGAAHEKAERAARKKFFADHPDERPDCYPDE